MKRAIAAIALALLISGCKSTPVTQVPVMTQPESAPVTSGPGKDFCEVYPSASSCTAIGATVAPVAPAPEPKPAPAPEPADHDPLLVVEAAKSVNTPYGVMFAHIFHFVNNPGVQFGAICTAEREDCLLMQVGSIYVFREFLRKDDPKGYPPLFSFRISNGKRDAIYHDLSESTLTN